MDRHPTTATVAVTTSARVLQPSFKSGAYTIAPHQDRAVSPSTCAWSSYVWCITSAQQLPPDYPDCFFWSAGLLVFLWTFWQARRRAAPVMPPPLCRRCGYKKKKNRVNDSLYIYTTGFLWVAWYSYLLKYHQGKPQFRRVSRHRFPPAGCSSSSALGITRSFHRRRGFELTPYIYGWAYVVRIDRTPRWTRKSGTISLHF